MATTLPDNLSVPVPLVASMTVPITTNSKCSSTNNNNNNCQKAQSFRWHRQGEPSKRIFSTASSCTSTDDNGQNDHNNKKLWIIRASTTSNSSINIKTNEDNRDDHEPDNDHEDLLLEQELTPSEKSHRRMHRFREQVTQSVHNVYDTEKMLRQVSVNGSLTTSVPEDIISLLHTFSAVLNDCFLQASITNDDTSDSIQPVHETLECRTQWFLDGMNFALKTIRQAHQHIRTTIITTSIEDCCAASNDFFRLSELIETFYEESFLIQFPFVKQSARGNMLKQEFDDLSNVMIHDAVAAAEYCQTFVMIHIIQQSTLKTDFFSSNWEDEWTSNQPANELIRIIDEHLNLTEQYMCVNPYLYNKSVVATVKAVVCFYLRCLIYKADAIDQRKRIHQRSMGMFLGNIDADAAPFHHHQRALLRMRDDIAIISSFFTDRINQGGHINHTERNDSTVLLRIVSNELWILKVIHECLQSTWVENDNDVVMGDIDSAALEGFVVVLHKRTGANSLVTRFLMSDLWLLTDSQMSKRGEIRRIVNHLEDDLHMVTTNMSDQKQQKSDERKALSPLRRRTNNNRTNEETLSLVTTLRVDEMLRGLYEERIAQGILPLCWLCLPKDVAAANGIDEDDSSNDIDRVIAAKIQKFTHNISQLPKHVIDFTQKMSKDNHTKR